MIGYADALQRRLAAWTGQDVGARIWRKDGTVWVSDPDEVRRTPELTDRLGWLHSPELMLGAVGELTAFAREVRDEGCRRVVLLGMGGSSLAPEVFMRIFGSAPGYPRFIVLDSTHPESVRNVEKRIDIGRTFFLVSSKSGDTLETLSFFKHFYERVRAVRPDGPGRSFAAITDAGSTLDVLARERGFRRVFHGTRTVGGRYSALTYFGLVPAALIGVDIREILSRGFLMAQACGPGVPPRDNPALAAGAAIGELALAGRDKLTFLISPSLAPFGAWVEQLIAESTGKDGKAILPVVDEEPGPPEVYGDDRAFVCIEVAGDGAAVAETAEALEKAGHPVLRFSLADREDLGGEFFRWELATAAAGAVLGINPFDQPDVEAAKAKAREAMRTFEEAGRLPSEPPAFAGAAMDVYGGPEGAAPADRLKAFLDQVRPGDYVAVMVYLPPTEAVDAALGDLRLALRARTKAAITLGYGPRFLHSTGQLHKGDGNTGLFIQITGEAADEIAVPGESYGFGTLIAAQAAGDRQALEDVGRRFVRFHLKGDVIAGVRQLRQALSV